MTEHEWRKYFAKIVAPEVFPHQPCGNFSGAVVIPVLGENSTFPAVYEHLLAADNFAEILLLLVINDYPDTPETHRLSNQKLLADLKNGRYPQAYWLECTGGKLSPPGVGSARKIGMDAAAGIIASAATGKERILFCLDGDTWVDKNYFSAVLQAYQTDRNCPVFIAKFHHRADSAELATAVKSYEEYIYQWRNGLHYAGSPYDYVAMGSTITVRVESYLKAGGMRCNSGGEDFYFLQAVRKQGKIKELADVTVYPAARHSDRVPFGTGQRLRQIMAAGGMDLTPPWAFEALKQVLEPVNNAADIADFLTLPAYYAGHLPPRSWQFFTERNFAANWRKICTNTPHDLPHLQAAFITWFDAFKTLKFIHFILAEQDHGFGGDTFTPAGKA